VVPGNVEEWDVKPADQILKIIKRQIPARQHDVRTKGSQLVAIERVVDFVSHRKYSRQMSSNVPSAVIQRMGHHINKDEAG
jgi:hypothetical protein